MKKELKRWLPDVLAVVFFALLAFAYFYPAVTDGRILYLEDASAGVGAGEEARQYYDKTGEVTRWTNALFGGMPTYQISPSYDSTKTLSFFEKAYHLWLPNYVWYLFAYLLGFYILLRAFNFKSYLAALGSILWAFSTYFLIIIAAGHLWKVMALVYLPPMIAGIVLAYKGKYISGLIVTAIFATFEMHPNHQQMPYYYMFIILAMVIAYLVEAIRQKQLAHFMKATAVCLVGGVLGLMVNASNLYHTWEYQKNTMRGGSELVNKDSNDQTGGGLERSYITNYSYGIGETWSLLVPNVKGGTSNKLLQDDEKAKKILTERRVDIGNGQSASCAEILDYVDYQFQRRIFRQYWEENLMPGATGTSGPVYVGAFVLMLFVIGLFVVKGPMKWALLAATVLSIVLAWGKNFMGPTDFFIDFVPLYSKFRTVESILVIAEFTIPLLAMLALKRIVEEPACMMKRVSKRVPLTPLVLGFTLTGVVALLFALFPTLFFDFTTSGEADVFNQIFGQQAGSAILSALSEARQAIFTPDCWRSFLIILVGAVLLWLYQARKLKAVPLTAALAVLCLFDLWQVNKRYLNDEMFQDPSVQHTTHAMKPVDKAILQDKSLDYRVLNFTTSTFNENETSYYHKSIGGYHAAKLGRYQDLIANAITPEMKTIAEHADSIAGSEAYTVLNMLNTKYFIVGDGENDAVLNPYAYGNAWLVDKVNYVDNANQEMEALHKTDLRHVAVADKQFEAVLGQSAQQDSTAQVVLNSYEPNQLNYTVDSPTGGVLVFSEIYYPGWRATIDGKEVELGRVNYVLRALHIDGGHHAVELTFKPTTVKTTETIAYIAFGVLLLLLLALVALQVYRLRVARKG